MRRLKECHSWFFNPLKVYLKIGTLSVEKEENVAASVTLTD